MRAIRDSLKPGLIFLQAATLIIEPT